MSDTNEPIWSPSTERIDNANITRFARELGARHGVPTDTYQQLWRFSVDQPEDFWRAVWDYCGVIADGPGEVVLEHPDAMPGARWFPEARLNFAENLLRHDDNRTALLTHCETGDEWRYSYAELRREVAEVAAALRELGVQPGDRVAGYMPNIAATAIAMLATASVGAVWSSCSPDFGIEGVYDRFGQIEPRVLFVAAEYCYAGRRHNYLDRARELESRIPSIERVVVVPYLAEGADLTQFKSAVLYDDFRHNNPAELTFERLPFDHPLYILFSSGTTGPPKCIVHGAGGTLLQHLKELMLHTDLGREDVFHYFTTCGWMMWNWMISALAIGCSVVLYDGAPFFPRPRRLFDLIDQAGISVLGTSAKSIAAWQQYQVKPRATHELTSLRTLLSTGSPLLPEQFDYVYADIKRDVCMSSISGGTDIVSCFALGNPTLPVYRGELQCPGLGMKVEIRGDDGEVLQYETGELTCSKPFPSMPVGFWNDPDGTRYHNAYFETFPGVWSHGDYARLTEHGGMVIYGRSDATLNPGGVRIGTAEIYRQAEKLDEVVESLCVGQDWQGDQRVVLFVRLREGLELDDELRERLRQAIRQNASPRHVPARILQVTDIPRTVSGKIVELAVRDVVHGRAVKNTDALANPEALEQFRDHPELDSD